MTVNLRELVDQALAECEATSKARLARLEALAVDMPKWGKAAQAAAAMDLLQIASVCVRENLVLCEQSRRSLEIARQGEDLVDRLGDRRGKQQVPLV